MISNIVDRFIQALFGFSPQKVKMNNELDRIKRGITKAPRLDIWE